MTKKEYLSLVNCQFLDSVYGRVRFYSNPDLIPFSYKEINELLIKQLDEKIDYHNIAISFPSNFPHFVTKEILLNHCTFFVHIRKILHAKGVRYKTGEKLISKKYSQVNVGYIIVQEGIAYIVDYSSHPFHPYNSLDKYYATPILYNEKDEKKGITIENKSIMFSGLFLENHRNSL